ncbi:MAG: T9SS type A sorting domain-containing protein [Bacteroidia bacterium]
MKKLHRILFAILFISISITGTTRASHIVGAYFSYQYVDTNEYLVTLHIYRDCAGITAPMIATICCSSASAGVSLLADLMPLAGTGNTLPMSSCVPYTSNCAAGLGTEEWVYTGTVILTQAAPDWVLGYEICCRNAAITTLLNGSAQGIYVFANIDNTNGIINSSPIFISNIFSQYCAGFYSTINYSCYDVDGDSLVYSLQPAEDATGTCPFAPYPLAYNIPFSANYPLSSFTPIGFNSATGLFDWTPAQIEVGEIGMRIDEYRNGVLIGSFKRDDQITIVQGLQNPNLIKGRVFMDYNYNNVQDAGEPGKQGAIVVALPVGIYGSTDSAGDYQLQTLTGTYDAIIPNAPKYYSTVPDTNSATFLALGQVDLLNDFAIQADTTIYDLSLQSCFGWSGRPCDTVNLYYTVTNPGTMPESALLTVNISPGLSVLASSPAADSISGNTLYWNTGVMSPLQTLTYIIPVVISCSDSAGMSHNITASLTTSNTDAYPADNNLSAVLHVVASLDPNFKEVDKIVLPQNLILNEWLTYTIHFQNIGSVDALNINIIDGLDNNVDPGSFEILASSHPCTFSMSGIGLVNFSFSNINLPSMLVNEAASHGFVQYRIKPEYFLIAGDKIQNAANIYFDTNPPVTTNTVETIVTNTTGINEVTSGHIDAVIYPNPFTSQLYVKMDHALKTVFELTDITGRSVIKKQLNQSYTFNTGFLSKGIYIYRLYDEKGNSTTGKLIKY